MGKVESIRNAAKYSGFLAIYIFIFSLIVIFSGCVERQYGIFADDVTPEQKKAELKKRLDRKYNDSQTHFLLAQLYHADRAWDDAEFHYNRAIQFDPVYRPAQAGMVKLFVDRGDTLKAQHYFESYLNQVGDTPSKIVQLAREFQEQGLDSYALTCLNKGLSLAPKSAEVHKALGYFYLDKNDREKARDHFEISFETDSTQKDVSYELGKLGVPVIYDAIPPVTDEIQ